MAKKPIPPRLLIMIGATSLLALVAFVVAVLLDPPRFAMRLLLEALGLSVAVLVTRRFPVHLTDKTKTTVATVPLFAAVLLLPAPLAMLTATAGILGAERLRHTRWFQSAFNAATAVLQVAVGALLFQSTGSAGLQSLAPGHWLVPALLTAAALYLVGTLLVEAIVSVQLQRVVLTRFWTRWWLSLPQEGLLSLLGLLLALVLVQAPWAVVLLPAPAWLVYRSLVTMAQGLKHDTQTAAPAHLQQLPRRLQLYIVSTAAVACLGGTGAYLLASPAWSWRVLATAGLITVLCVLSYRLPIKPLPKRVIILDGALVLAALLTLPLAVVCLVVAISTAAGNLVQRRPWFNLLFNIGQQLLAALVAALLYHALSPVSLADSGRTLQSLAAAVAAAAAYWTVSCLLVDGIMAVQFQRSPFVGWLAAHQQSLLVHVVLLPLGIAVSPLVTTAPWVLVLLLLPAAVVRTLLHTARQLDAQTGLLVEDLIAVLAESCPQLPAQAQHLAELTGTLASAYGLRGEACRQVVIASRLAVAAAVTLEDGSPAAREPWAVQSLRTLMDAPALREPLIYRYTAYDGSTDPAGPRGAGIPLAARILAVAQAWLALTAPDGGGPTLELNAVLRLLLAGAGTAFDPEVVGLLGVLNRQAQPKASTGVLTAA